MRISDRRWARVVQRELTNEPSASLPVYNVPLHGVRDGENNGERGEVTSVEPRHAQQQAGQE